MTRDADVVRALFGVNHGVPLLLRAIQGVEQVGGAVVESLERTAGRAVEGDTHAECEHARTDGIYVGAQRGAEFLDFVLAASHLEDPRRGSAENGSQGALLVRLQCARVEPLDHRA